MMVLITPPTDIEHETRILNELFEAGLTCCHLNKPHKTREEVISYLGAINSPYHQNIVLHHYHELINEFDLKGIHFSEQDRKEYIETPIRYFKDLNLFGKTLSSTFHEIQDLEASDFEFDYYFLRHSGTKTMTNKARADVNTSDHFIIGMEPIDQSNLGEILNLGYQGIGLSTNIWESKDPVGCFLDFKNAFNKLWIQS